MPNSGYTKKVPRVSSAGSSRGGYRRVSRRSAATIVGAVTSALPSAFIGRAREEACVSRIPRQLDEIAGRELAGREPVLDLDGQRPRRAQRHRVPRRIARVDDLVDRKSTRLNSSHQIISYAVFCLKKKKKNKTSS